MDLSTAPLEARRQRSSAMKIEKHRFYPRVSYLAKITIQRINFQLLKNVLKRKLRKKKMYIPGDRGFRMRG